MTTSAANVKSGNGDLFIIASVSSLTNILYIFCTCLLMFSTHFFPQKLSFNFLRNSFNIIPQCNLVFHPATKPGKSSFFVVMALTHEPTSTTVMYASTTIKKVVIIIVNTAIVRSSQSLG